MAPEDVADSGSGRSFKSLGGRRGSDALWDGAIVEVKSKNGKVYEADRE